MKNIRLSRWGLTAVLALVFVLGWFSGMYLGPAAAVAGNGTQHMAAGTEAKTVFVDIGPFGKHRRAAKHITDMHVKMAAQGWTVIDVEPYTENADLQGFFVTYIRKTP